MTDSTYTHIAIIADRSGSMGGRADGKISKAERSTTGIHDLVRRQKAEPGRVTFSLTEFDTSHSQVEEFGDGSNVARWYCSPRGGTALFDAMGFQITALGEKLAAMPEGQRPARVIVVTATDGEENSSREYSLEQLKKLITQQQDLYKWDFVFIGADIDAFSAAGAMGVSTGSTMTTSDVYLAQAYASTNSAISRSRASGQSLSYTPEERTAAGDTSWQGTT